MRITDCYTKKKPGLSFEIFPPKHDDYLRDIEETLKILAELSPDYISVTFGAGGSMNNSKTIDICRHIKNEYGIEPLVHLTCLNYGKDEIDVYLEAMEREGLKNILALRGDRRPEMPEKKDFPHASDLIAYLKTRGDFCIAGACYPEAHPDSPDRVSDIRNLKKKVDAGAEVLISQLFFDNNDFYRFREDCRIAGIDVPITPGIMPVINKKQIGRMVTMCGASLPERFAKILDRYGDLENKNALFDAGMAYAVSQVIDLLANGADGIHLYTMNDPRVAKRIAESIRNLI